ncbi:DUF6428 family protein [Flavobacterium turcicum]|uniref:Uncharacterized protein n=1 Tax=Flavobacterium turcicum TaxID=2764718 RepID=A0ABR7JJI0_9FLAO|nr:DUF6428 family protein [Flavobacterium turcicum]MBC5864644.1 hypothetical protein [Flavobacterium turcicum]NHL03385.1 hypothetical protein [Flavobacterium turcicum]
MKLSEIKAELHQLNQVTFVLPDGTYVPEHFHVTEVGLLVRRFVDCGGKLREEKIINFQLWDANDYDHRLKPAKLLNIINISEKMLEMDDYEVEVEYQSNTIGRYDLGFNGTDFLLLNKQTACLAEDQCGIPAPKQKLSLNTLTNNSCTPGGGCC